MTTKTASRMSTLNPNAPLFIPASYLATEDFSPQWWHLVQTCPAFRDFWLRERFDSMEDEAATPPVLDTTDDFDLEDLLDMEMQNEELVKAVDMAPWKEANDVVSESEKDVIAALAGVSVNELRSQQRIWREPLKYHDKISNKGPRSPRKGGNNQFRIQQPRP